MVVKPARAMGCTLSAADEADRKRSDEIDKTLAAEHLNKTNEIKLLLLGRQVCMCVCVHQLLS